MFSYTLFKFGPYEVCLWNLIFLFIIFFIAYILRRVIHKNLKRLLLNKNIHVEGRGATWLRIMSQSVYLLAAYAAVNSFSFNNREIDFLDFLSYNLIKTRVFTLSFAHIIGIVAVIFSAKLIVNLITLFITRRVKNRINLDEGSEFIYIQLAKYVIYVMGMIISLQILEVNLTVFLTGSAALLVGIGLGLQDVFRDIFSGIVLLFEGNVRVGDVVEIYNTADSTTVVAKIIKINVRTTHIETRNGNVLIIPNNKLTQEYVENWSHGTTLSRFIIDVNVAYGSDTELVKKLLKQSALSHPNVNKVEPVLVRLKDFGENGLSLELVFWAEQSWDVSIYKSDIRFEIDRLFREHKIEIPYPKRDVILPRS
jgi:small-conductance mechanosensitive channel